MADGRRLRPLLPAALLLLAGGRSLRRLLPAALLLLACPGGRT